MQSCYAVRAEGGKPQLFLATKTQTELRGGKKNQQRFDQTKALTLIPPKYFRLTNKN
jgi:hypothetical protein